MRNGMLERGENTQEEHLGGSLILCGAVYIPFLDSERGPFLFLLSSAWPGWMCGCVDVWM